MILDEDTPVHVHNSRKIKRKHGGVVVSESEPAMRKCVIGSAPVFRIETTDNESENNEGIPVPSKYIEVSHDPTSGVYQDDTDDSF
jgi:hypothetical protein